MAGIPVLTAEGDCIAGAWENALVLLYGSGCNIKTQYDKPDDPPSKDATMMVTIADPLAEPMIHRDFPGGFEELAGVRDGGLRRHQGPLRPRPARPGRHPLGIHLPPAAVPVRGAHAGARSTRSSTSAGSWPTRPTRAGPRRSPGRSGKTTPATIRPACKASGAGSSHEDGRPLLNMNVRFRSNDAYKAAFMNMFALTHLQAKHCGPDRRAIGQAGRAGALLPHRRQLSHLRVEPGRVRGPLPRRDPETHLRAADDALRGRARDDGSRPAGDFGEGAADGRIAL